MENNEVISTNWERLLDQLQAFIGKRPADVNSLLFLIGIQELGKGPKHFSKEQKQDLMHIAICKVLSLSDYYAYTGVDKDGWPQYELVKPLPHGDILAQEEFLKIHILKYFAEYLPAR